jgi:hypothetical protein
MHFGYRLVRCTGICASTMGMEVSHVTSKKRLSGHIESLSVGTI